MLEGWAEATRGQRDQRASKRARIQGAETGVDTAVEGAEGGGGGGEEDVSMSAQGSRRGSSSKGALSDAVVGPEEKDGERGKGKEKEDTQVAKTDKVLIGNKTSWAIARAIGEVRLCTLVHWIR